MPKAVKGVLINCDPSIKAIILKIDQEYHDYIVEDLDDQTLVIKESQLPRLKERLEEVGNLRKGTEMRADWDYKLLQPPRVVKGNTTYGGPHHALNISVPIPWKATLSYNDRAQFRIFLALEDDSTQTDSRTAVR
ncbi:MAG: hypothetical protein Q9182_006223 [Xanthomendoza sp. 2 TL-2023]